MLDQIQQIFHSAVHTIEHASSLQELEDIEKTILGKTGSLTTILKGLKDLSPEEKAHVGGEANRVKKELLEIYFARKTVLEKQIVMEQIASQWQSQQQGCVAEELDEQFFQSLLTTAQLTFALSIKMVCAFNHNHLTWLDAGVNGALTFALWAHFDMNHFVGFIVNFHKHMISIVISDHSL